jgi:precorrin-2 dehydrogenase/sirohydrochlorin ferrochelatase
MIPLLIDCAGKRIVIFGGGRVAARKAAYFADRADVHVISRSHAKPVTALPVRRSILDLKKASDTTIAKIIRGAFLVVAALSDRDQNTRIGRICRKEKVLFNNADGERGDVIIPSVSRGKRYTIAVTTHGKSPAISRFIRQHLDDRFRMLDEMIALQEKLRAELKAAEASQERRSAILWDILQDPEVWDALSHSQSEAEKLARRRHLHGE